MKFRFSVSIGLQGCRREETVTYIEDEELEGKTEEERKKIIDEYYQDWLQDNIDGGWTELDD